MRPAENGMSSHPAAQIVKDPAKMTKEERQEYARRAARGEDHYIQSRRME